MLLKVHRRQFEISRYIKDYTRLKEIEKKQKKDLLL